MNEFGWFVPMRLIESNNKYVSLRKEFGQFGSRGHQ